MSSSNKNKHLSFEERVIIETGIRNGSSKKSIADTLGKDKSTIGKEIKLHRILSKKCNLPGILKLTHKTSHKQYTSPFFINL